MCHNPGDVIHLILWRRLPYFVHFPAASAVISPRPAQTARRGVALLTLSFRQRERGRGRGEQKVRRRRNQTPAPGLKKRMVEEEGEREIENPE